MSNGKSLNICVGIDASRDKTIELNISHEPGFVPSEGVVSSISKLVSEIVGAPAASESKARHPDVSQPGDEYNSLISLFESAVQKDPDAIAITSGGSSLTYRQLSNKADNVANLLLSQDLPATSTIGICMEKENDLVITILAVLKGGWSFIQMDVSLPDAELNSIATENYVAAVVTMASDIHRFSKFKEKVIAYDIQLDVPGMDAQSVSRAAEPEVLLYLSCELNDAGKPRVEVRAQHDVVKSCNDIRRTVFDGKTNISVGLVTKTIFDPFIKILFACFAGNNAVHLAPEVFSSEKKRSAFYDKYSIQYSDEAPANSLAVGEAVGESIRKEMTHLGIEEVKINLNSNGDSRKALLVLSSPEGGQCLGGYVSQKNETGKELVHFFVDRIPSGYVDKTSANGFLRRKKPAIAPSTDTEKAVFDVWKEVLGATVVSANDNFFDLGGHSINAVQIISRLNKHFQVSLRIDDIFSNPTVTEVAARIDAILWASPQNSSSAGVSFVIN
jgi:acyl carrier protein